MSFIDDVKNKTFNIPILKYIRTKDGVYEYLNNSRITETGLWEVATDCGNEGFFGRFRGEVVDQADTIEELCDEFVCEENHYLMKPYWLKYNDDGYCDETYHQGIMNAFRNKHFNYKDYHWFGAIWTDKGLIYVAKISDKGELELL